MRGAFSWNSKGPQQEEVLNVLNAPEKAPGNFCHIQYILRGSKLAYKYAIFTFVWVREGTVKRRGGWGQTQVVHFSCNAKQLNNAPNMMNYSRQKTCRKLTERGKGGVTGGEAI